MVSPKLFGYGLVGSALLLGMYNSSLPNGGRKGPDQARQSAPMSTAHALITDLERKLPQTPHSSARWQSSYTAPVGLTYPSARRMPAPTSQTNSFDIANPRDVYAMVLGYLAPEKLQ